MASTDRPSTNVHENLDDLLEDFPLDPPLDLD